ncbi:SusC/RagA family TonB-linked outer membrane protein [Proteiniphilum sp. X52]|uniref:SusC/RagA family TonB-linked outer membrane protein n=1 Tax=Proteiniphilum sp. X52 TaxID=2382159 RepID=UPI000F09BA20|nr:SusC/RagA family TonB-linked outer membrane protein [Proteiniphilum sp. X52]RNC65521.1 SusC/RagA family TonB-linked outer membrane protein [Proteiniphilum sp. X52]
MKKNNSTGNNLTEKVPTNFFLLIMRVTIILLFTGIFCTMAETGYTQNARVTINKRNTTLREILNEIEKQTDYLFIYNNEVKTNSKVSIKAKQETVSKVLNSMLKKRNLDYSMEGNHIILSAKQQKEEATEKVIAQQQKKQISGTVTDVYGEPVIGANIIEVGTASNGTVTDVDGNFSLQVENDAIIRISYIGYREQEINTTGETSFTIILQEETEVLDEVVVTALGIKRQKRSLGYSTTQVGGEEFTLARDVNLGNALSGKIAGVTVAGNATGAGGSSRVIIRGNASLTGNNQPLYVVDGIPFDNTNQASAGTWGGLDGGDGLSNINPDDIESIQVLKGAAASALYGYRGGNGAILITTKSGQKGKGVSIEFNNNLTFNNIYDYRDFQTIYGQGSMGQRPLSADVAKATETSSWGERLDGGKAVNFLGNEYTYSYIDNWKNFYRTGINNVTSVGISQASDNITYRFGVSNMYEKGILPNSGISQQSINTNTTYDITDKLHLTVNANYVFEKFNGRSNLSDGNGNTNASLLYRANSFDVRWLERGSESADWGTTDDGKELIGGTNEYFNNPYWLQYRKTNEMNKNRLTGSITLRYDITDWLYAQGAVQRDGYNIEFKQVQPIGAAADPNGFMNEYAKNFSETNMNYLIGFNKLFGDWSVDATVGGNRLHNLMKQWLVDGGRPFIVDGLWSVNNLADHRFKKNYAEYKVNSIYGTVDFGWKNQIFLNLTGRNDWFSTLSPENNQYFYPSATLSWVFTDTFKMPDWFTFGKARASYASASNGTSAYQNLLTYKISDYVVNGQKVATVNTSTFPNPNLKPVRISEYEGGLNLAFLRNRLSFDMAYYVKNTRDDIAVVTVSSATGYSAQIQNVGEIENRGVEFMVNAVPVHNRHFGWNTTFNIAHNNSEVKYLGENVEMLQIDGASSRSGNVTVQNIVGRPYGELVGYKYLRHNGEIVYKDGLPQRETDLSVLGNGVYKLTGGWNNQFSYKNITLALLLDFKFGAKIFSGTNLSLTNSGLHKNTLQGRENAAAGTIIGKGVMLGADGESYVPNTVAKPAQEYWQSIVSNSISEEFIYDASFIKLRELALGYNLPKSLLSRQQAVKEMSISLVARNLWTILKHTDNIDPESAYNNTNGQGLELNGYPATRSIGFNVNIKF